MGESLDPDLNHRPTADSFLKRYDAYYSAENAKDIHEQLSPNLDRAFEKLRDNNVSGITKFSEGEILSALNRAGTKPGAFSVQIVEVKGSLRIVVRYKDKDRKIQSKTLDSLNPKTVNSSLNEMGKKGLIKMPIFLDTQVDE